MYDFLLVFCSDPEGIVGGRVIELQAVIVSRTEMDMGLVHTWAGLNEK